MTDPAVEAADRVLIGAGATDAPDVYRDAMIHAAREALKPIRELHARFYMGTACDCCEGAWECAACGDYWPCDTARLVYTTQEIGERIMILELENKWTGR